MMRIVTDPTNRPPKYKLTFKGFMKSNWVYILYLILYFILSIWVIGFTANRFIIVTIAYCACMLIAISEMGEQLLRVLNNVRKLETKKEKEYLIPIYEEVYKKVKRVYSGFDNVEICIIDAMYINACALGTRTIAVTRGAMHTLSEDELKGLIAHEFGHIVHGHTIASLLTTVGNGIFTVIVVITKVIIGVIDFTISMMAGKGFLTALASVIKGVLELLVFVVVYIGELILSISSRQHEYEADQFAFRLKYGKQLIESLYLLHDMTISTNKSLVQKMKASHPHIAKRIGRLEYLVDLQTKKAQQQKNDE